MAGLFNNSTNLPNTTPVPDNVTGDFSDALASIGTAIGEMKNGIEGMESGVERAVVKALVSDEVNNALYDAIASATYDAVGDAYSDGRMGKTEVPRSQQTADESEDYALKELLAVNPKSDMDALGDTLSNSIGEMGGTIAKAIDDISAGTRAVQQELLAERDDAIPDVDIEQDEHEEPDDLSGTTDNSSSDGIAKDIVLAMHPDDSTETKPNSDVSPNIAESSFEMSEKKRLDDLTLTMLSNVLPNFISKGNTVFDKILDDDINVRLSDDTVDMLTDSWSSGLKKMPLPKVGPSSALSVATIAALGAIGLAGKKFYDWMKTSEETEKTIRDFTEANSKSNLERKAGANDSMRDAADRAMKSEAEVGIEEQKVFKNTAQKMVLDSSPILTMMGPVGLLASSVGRMAKALGAKTSLENAQERAAKDNQAFSEERNRYIEKKQMASEYGVDTTDVKAISRWEDEQKKRAIDSGIDVEDRDAFAKFQREELDRYKATRQPIIGGTQPNGPIKPDDAYNVEFIQNTNSMPDMGPTVPMAAGSTVNNTPMTMNAGTGAMTEDILTMEQQFQQYRKFMFEGIRDALLLPEIRAMFSDTARAAGTAVQGSLMG